MNVNISIYVTIPKTIFNSEQLVAELKTLLRTQTAPDITTLFEGTVEGWETKPGFFRKFNFSQDRLAVTVYPVGKAADIYALVNAGSPPHPIPARRARTLRFQIGYRPSTTPGVLTSRAKARFGAWYTPVSIPNHPGFAARKFDETIGERYRSVFEKSVQNIFERVSKF